jgi:hypothetical protein
MKNEGMKNGLTQGKYQAQDMFRIGAQYFCQRREQFNKKTLAKA